MFTPETPSSTEKPKRKAWYQVKIEELEAQIASGGTRKADVPLETGIFRAPAVAWMLIWNEYAKITHNFSFCNARESIRKDKTGTSWKISHDREAIIVTTQPDRARFELAQQEAGRIEMGLSDLMTRHRNAWKELRRRKETKQDSEQIARAQDTFNDVDEEMRYARDRHEECRLIVEAAQPVMYRIPIAAMHELEANDIPLTVSQVQASGRFIRKIELPDLAQKYMEEPE